MKNAYNGNNSDIHWDMVMIQRPEYGGGEIYFDDVLIRKDGRFVIPELKSVKSGKFKISLNKNKATPPESFFYIFADFIDAFQTFEFSRTHKYNDTVFMVFQDSDVFSSDIIRLL